MYKVDFATPAPENYAISGPPVGLRPPSTNNTVRLQRTINNKY
jgi:hypothetical protein